MKLAPVLSVKSFLEKTDVLQDDLLSTIVDSVSKRIETYLNRLLTKAARTEYYDAGRRYYYLPAYPIDQDADLTVTYDGSAQNIDDDFFVWYDKGLIEFQNTPTRNEPKQICITYTGGYAESAVSQIIGSDALNYTCIIPHKAAAANKPITGASYASYWSQTGTGGVAWVSGTNYYAFPYLVGVPEDIAWATIMQSAFIFRKRDSIGVSSFTLPDGSQTINSSFELLPEVKKALKSHRKPASLQ